jgi:hypothetical protein
MNHIDIGQFVGGPSRHRQGVVRAGVIGRHAWELAAN